MLLSVPPELWSKQLLCYNLSHALHALLIRMNAVGLHHVLTIGKQCMQVDHLQPVLTSHLLLDSNNIVLDDGIIDVPCRLKGRYRCAKIDLRLCRLDCLYH